MPTSDELKMLQALPLDLKIRRTQQRIREWVDHWGKDHVYVSFSGGKDSTVLLHIVRQMYGDEIPAVFVNTGLEYPEIQNHVRSFPNVVVLRPEMNFREVLTKYGYPVISKEVSQSIYEVRKFYSNFVNVEREREREREGETEAGLPRQVQKLYGLGQYANTQDFHGSLENYSELVSTLQDAGQGVPLGLRKVMGLEDYGVQMVRNIPKLSRYSQVKYKSLLEADFMISHKCCDIMKKRPSHDYTKKTKSYPLLGTMADESMVRENAWIRYGCNSFEGKYPSSKPMSFWTDQDVLRYIVDNSIAIPSVYGEVVPDGEHDQIAMLRNDAGRLTCTGCNRTGCIFCGFGLGSELLSREGRFVRLARTHPKQYAYVMGGGAYDPEDGYWKPTKEGLGFAHVFDEINRLIPTKTGRPYIRYLPEGGEMDRARKLDEEKKKQKS